MWVRFDNRCMPDGSPVNNPIIWLNIDFVAIYLREDNRIFVKAPLEVVLDHLEITEVKKQPLHTLSSKFFRRIRG